MKSVLWRAKGTRARVRWNDRSYPKKGYLKRTRELRVKNRKRRIRYCGLGRSPKAHAETREAASLSLSSKRDSSSPRVDILFDHTSLASDTFESRHAVAAVRRQRAAEGPVKVADDGFGFFFLPRRDFPKVEEIRKSLSRM